MQRVQLTITMDAQGHLSVNGPLEQKGLCYMLLELARDAVRDYDPAAHQGLVMPNGVPAEVVRRMRGEG